MKIISNITVLIQISCIPYTEILLIKRIALGAGCFDIRIINFIIRTRYPCILFFIQSDALIKYIQIFFSSFVLFYFHLKHYIVYPFKAGCADHIPVKSTAD